MKKIAVYIPNLTVGGAERVAIILVNHFSKMEDISVDFILMNKKGELISDVNKKVNIVDLSVKNEKKEFFGLLKLRSYIRNEKPDSLLCIMWPLTIVGVIAKLISFSQVNLVLSDHTTFSKTPWIKNKIKRLIFRLSINIFYPLANCRLNVSNNASRDLEELGWLKGKSIKTIYNPVELYQGEICKQKNIEKNVISVGSLKWAKNHELLIKSFKLVLLKDENVKLTIVGDGEMKEKLQSLAKSLEISNKIDFVGNKKGQELENIYLNADLLVLSSHYEGFSVVILEALNYGVAVVSVDCDNGPREILGNGAYGCLVPINDEKLLSENIIKQLNSNTDINFLRKRASDFSVNIIAEKYLNIL